MEELEKLKLLTGESNEKLLSLLIEEATAFVLSYTGRTKIVTSMEKTVRDLVVIAVNRRGTEGESGRSEGGESYSFDNAPKSIYDILDRHRLAKVGGKRYENQAESSKEVLP